MPKEFKQMLSACHKADGNCFLGQERGVDNGIYATRTTIRPEAYCETLKKMHMAGHSELKAWNADIQCSAPP
jgi:hypothetical protein